MSGMTKVGTGAKLEDSNIARYGSKEHKDAKKAAAQTETAWAGAGQKVGVEIWRIEKFQVIRWPTSQYGSFFSGDSYIVLNSYKTPDSDAFKYNVHFWLGKETSQDEAGTAAYKTVELDDLLGDVPVQFREVEGFESKEFMDIFKGKICYMDGGVDSGFNHVKPTEYKARLLHLKSTANKKNVRVSQVPLAAASLNDGDVFILDNGMELIQWNGKSSGIFEKRKAADVIQALRNDRNGRPSIKVMDGVEENPSFWTALGESKCPASVHAAIPDTDEKIPDVEPSLWRLSDASGKLQMTVEAKGKSNIKKSLLDQNDVFILDTSTHLFAWVGNKASSDEKTKATILGSDYLVAQGRNPRQVSIQREISGRETKAFWSHFV
jgi:gelsolin